MAKTERLEFRADPEFIEKVQDLADRDGVTRAEIVRRAVGLYEYAATLAQQGMVLKPTEIPTAGTLRQRQTLQQPSLGEGGRRPVAGAV